MKTYSNDISLVLGGSAGQGIQTVEALLMVVLKRAGYRVFANKEYMSRIRGGSNSTEIRIMNGPHTSYVKRIDFLFALDKGVVTHLGGRIGATTVVLGDAKKLGAEKEQSNVEHFVDVPFGQFAQDLGSPLYTSTVAVAVALGMLGVSRHFLDEYLTKRFAKKGEEMVAKNLEAATKGHAFGLHIAYDQGFEVHLIQDKAVAAEMMLSGNDALGLGALAAGCNYVSSYPMSPGTGLFTFLANAGKEFGVVIDQAEDEIAAINQVLGAWYAGARGLVTTSGGGFALMCEGVSLAGMIETPLVVHVGMRPGPATGLPTRTEQADLDLVLYAGHGEFPRVIFAPGSHQEAFEYMQAAFALADEFQIPAFMLTDQFFLDSIKSFDKETLTFSLVTPQIIKSKADYLRYQVTESGISPRAIPGYGEGLVAVDSDEHTEDGRITESAAVRVAMHEKRLRKMKALTDRAIMPTTIGDIETAKTVVVTWGSNKGVLKEALDASADDSIAGLHFAQVFPLAPAAAKWLTGKRVVVMENNATGQFARLLRDQYALETTESILQYDGSPFALEDVKEQLTRFV
jgi:2-oxoglutarate ferredoxin oxidoreductase subunit alpha